MARVAVVLPGPPSLALRSPPPPSIPAEHLVAIPPDQLPDGLPDVGVRAIEAELREDGPVDPLRGDADLGPGHAHDLDQLQTRLVAGERVLDVGEDVGPQLVAFFPHPPPDRDDILGGPAEPGPE